MTPRDPERKRFSSRQPPSPHYIREIVAERLPREMGRARVHAILQTHLEQATAALPRGTRDAPVDGRATAERILVGLRSLLRSAPRRIAGSATEFCAVVGVSARPETLAAALRLIAMVTPLLLRRGRYAWEIDLLALRRAAVDDPRVESLAGWLPGDATERTSPVRSASGEQQEPATEPDLVPTDHGANRGPQKRDHARGRSEFLDPAAEPHAHESGHRPGLGCAPGTPAENDRARPAVSPASAPVALTASGWTQAIPGHRRQRQAAELVGRFGDVEDEGRGALGVARALLDLRDSTVIGGRAGSREVAAVARGLLGLQARGLLTASLGLPQFALHPWLTALGIRQRPGGEPPTIGQRRYLRRCGVDPAGLSRAEARALQASLQLRRGEGLAWPRQIQRVLQQDGGWERLTSACAAGRVPEGLADSLAFLRACPESFVVKLASGAPQ